MAVSRAEQAKIADDLLSRSSDSSDEAIAVCKISPLTSLHGKTETKMCEESDPNSMDDKEDGALVIDETEVTVTTEEENSNSKNDRVEYKRQVSTPLKKRKLLPAEDEPEPGVEVEIGAGAEEEHPAESESDLESDPEPEEETKTDTETIDPTTFGLPAGWTRRLTERMSGASAGKIDVYLTSPEGKRCRSMKEVTEHLQKTKSPLTPSDFIFKPKEIAGKATPAMIKSPQKPQAKRSKSQAKAAPVKRSKSRDRSETKAKKAKAEKETRVRERKRRSPTKSATLPKKKTAKEPRKVLKPPPEKASLKASRQQKFQKLLVKINFQKGTSDVDGDDVDEEEEDSFDEGSEQEEEEMEPVSPQESPKGVK